jgi:hypothetical protein
MNKKAIFDILILIILFIGNIIINGNYFFFLIYLFLSIYHIYIFYLIIISKRKKKLIKFIFLSIILYILTYFIIYDPNPIFCFVSYYIFYPNFLKSILIIFFHTYFLSRNSDIKEYNLSIYIEKLPLKRNEISIKSKVKNSSSEYYFFSCFIRYSTRNKKRFFFVLLSIIFIIILNIFLFLHRIKIWIYFNNKEKILPISSSKNTTFYITSMICNMGDLIGNYISQMKKLINYLGYQNVVISIIENGDSKDKTREYLKEFQEFLNNNKIINEFLLNHEIDDPRRKIVPFVKCTPLRIKFYAQLRNRCFDLLYKLHHIDFNNTKIIFFNDIFFEYQDIVHLLSTNNEDYDAVCGLDFSDVFYDRWVSIDLDGNSLKPNFPFFINKEAQDLIVNHNPIRVFSCWNGVIAFNAAPLKDKKIQFRYKENDKPRKYKINNDQKVDYESECTYFHIDLFSLGYTKKLINPDVRVTYYYSQNFLKRKYYYPFLKEILSYFKLYFQSFKEKRNKYMSNYKDKIIKFNPIVENWYLENKKVLNK